VVVVRGGIHKSGRRNSGVHCYCCGGVNRDGLYIFGRLRCNLNDIVSAVPSAVNMSLLCCK